MRILILIATFFLFATGCSMKKNVSKTEMVAGRLDVARQKIELPTVNLKVEYPIEQIDTLRIHDTIKVKDKATEAELRIWKDNYGKLQAECEAKGGSVTTEVSSNEVVAVDNEEKQVERKGGLWWGILIGAVGLLLAQVLIKTFLTGVIPLR